MILKEGGEGEGKVKLKITNIVLEKEVRSETSVSHGFAGEGGE